MIIYPLHCRLLGPVLARYVYWLDGVTGRVAIPCISFDRDTEEFINTPDPVQELTNEVPYFSYVCSIIDRKDGKVKPLILKKSVFKQILGLNSKHGDPSHPETGFDLSITKQVSGLGKFDVSYNVKAVKRTKLNGEKPLDLEKKYPVCSYDEVLEMLRRKTTIFLGEVPKIRVNQELSKEDYDDLA